jgi:hypothetical protein
MKRENYKGRKEKKNVRGRRISGQMEGKMYWALSRKKRA